MRRQTVSVSFALICFPVAGHIDVDELTFIPAAV
jgi:hypothetical protein